MNLLDKLLNKDYDARISCADEAFSEYFNDNDMSKDAFFVNKVNKSKSTKKVTRFSTNLKPSDVKQLLENIKNSNKK